MLKVGFPSIFNPARSNTYYWVPKVSIFCVCTKNEDSNEWIIDNECSHSGTGKFTTLKYKDRDTMSFGNNS